MEECIHGGRKDSKEEMDGRKPISEARGGEFGEEEQKER